VNDQCAVGYCPHVSPFVVSRFAWQSHPCRTPDPAKRSQERRSRS
jgi:hypothetical protein